MVNKVSYITSMWIGPRQSSQYSRVTGVSPYYMLFKHLEFLSSLPKDHPIQEAIFVFSVDENFMGDTDEIISLVNSIPFNFSSVKVSFRKNLGYSYGAWEETLRDEIPNSEYDYYFLIEDDYIPTTSNFLSPFFQMSSSSTPFVCQLWAGKGDVELKTDVPHAAISNGMLNTKIAQKIYEKYKKILNVDFGSAHRNVGVKNQIQFTNYLEEFGIIKDVSKLTSIPFCESNHKDKIKNFGDPTKSIVIEPLKPDFSFWVSKLEFEDLTFMNQIRNFYAKKFLHTPKTFTQKECEQWFLNTKPDYYIISHLDVRIGYFRISQYSPETQSLYLGADLHPKLTGKGLGKQAYQFFIPFIKEKYNLKQIHLEVLHTNSRAISLYNKLGFEMTDIKKNAVYSENQWKNSILMTLNLEK
jgi:RimJ/RimL family protein N-acetyltransferase